MTEISTIFFYIDDIDKNKYSSLSNLLKNRYDIVNKCFKYSVNDTKTKFGVNVSLNASVDKEMFDDIVKSIIGHFEKNLNFFFKTGNETDAKYTMSNLKPKTEVKKKCIFIEDSD